MSHNKKTITFFFAKVVGFSAILFLLWPAVRGGYTYLFSAAGDAVFGNFGSAGRTRFVRVEPRPTDTSTLDFSIKLENVRTRRTGTFEPERNTRNMGYLPTAFTAALILATPIAWKRRGFAMLWAILLICAFIGLQLALHLLNAFSDPNELNQFALTPWTKRLVVIALKVVVMSPVSAYIAPIFVWILVTFRRGDWAKLLASPTSPRMDNS